MRIIPVEQGSKAWLDWRKTRITASDASIILRSNKYTNPRILWDEKMDHIPSTPVNEHMERGKNLEPVARKLFIEQTGIHVEPLVIESDNFLWMGASLDGIDATRKILIEIKCPTVAGHVAALNKEIKPMYRDQMQHALASTQAEICFYVTYNESHEQPLNILEVPRDEKAIELLIEAEQAFYFEFMCGSFKSPPTDWKYKAA